MKKSVASSPGSKSLSSVHHGGGHQMWVGFALVILFGFFHSAKVNGYYGSYLIMTTVYEAATPSWNSTSTVFSASMEERADAEEPAMDSRDAETKESAAEKIPPQREEDRDCVYKDSPLYRKVFVYPSPGEVEYNGSILSEVGRNRVLHEQNNHTNATLWPWQMTDNQSRQEGSGLHANTRILAQFTTELIVRDLFTLQGSCLRTWNPDEADLFYVPYLPSTELHAGKTGMPRRKTSPYAQAIMTSLDGNYDLWEERFGLTSRYWKQRNGSDHILVFSEPLQGLWHPKGKRGNFHYVETQKQLSSAIVISAEVSTTFVQMYPKCMAKNVLVPYPITDGRVYNGQLDEMARARRDMFLNHTSSGSNKTTAAPSTLLNDFMPVWYKAGVHGECVKLRVGIQRDYRCSTSQKIVDQMKKTTGNIAFHEGMRMATFCPSPGGDSPSAKRSYDAILAGCIPIILSHDFVWPFSTELPGNENVTSINPSEFSIRLPAANFSMPHHKKVPSCERIVDSETKIYPISIHDMVGSLSEQTISNLRNGVAKARELYSFYSFHPESPGNPLLAGIVPDGGAARALVQSLAERARGVRWPACQKELERANRPPDPTQFVC